MMSEETLDGVTDGEAMDDGAESPGKEEDLEKFLSTTDRVCIVNGPLIGHSCDALLLTSMHDIAPGQMEDVVSRYADLRDRFEVFKSNPKVAAEDGPSRILSLTGYGGRILFARITDKHGAVQSSLLRRVLAKICGGEIKTNKGTEKFPVGAKALQLPDSPRIAIPRICQGYEPPPIGINMIELIANAAARSSLIDVKFELYFD